MYSERIAMDHYHQDVSHPGVAMTSGMQGEQPLVTPLQPQTVVLKDGETVATMYPIPSVPQLLPPDLLSFLLDEFNMEVEKGDSFPYYETLTMEEFQDVWFNRDGHICIMVLGEIPELDYSVEDIYPADPSRSKSSTSTTGYKTGQSQQGRDPKSEEYLKRKRQRNFNTDVHWDRQCLGIFQLQPAYPGRSSHVVTGTFLVNAGIRGKGIGKTLMETFVEWSKKLGFTSCCFPLIYETNVGIRCILEGLNFRRVGKLPEAGILKGYDVPVDSFIYAKEFTHIKKSIDMMRDPEKNHEIAKYERLRYYMETGEYPLHCDRNEKARLRVTAKSHTLLNGKLMTKNREVVYDPETQRQIVLDTHQAMHEGINKVTGRIAKKYHWKGIKNTVSEVIAQCQKCKMRYPDENGIIVQPGDTPVPQAHMLPSLMINATDLTNKSTAVPSSKSNNDIGNQTEVPTPVDADLGISRKRTNSEVTYDESAAQPAASGNRESESDKTMAYATPTINTDGASNNTFDRFISDELSRKRAHYIDAATKVLVDMNDNSTTTQDSTSKQTGNNHVMTDAMLNLEDNVMAALEIVQKEQQEQQQRTAEEQADQLRRQRENEQFLLSFNFDAEYHEEEDEDYKEDADEDADEDDEEEDEEEEAEEEYETASHDGNGINQDDVQALLNDKYSTNFDQDNEFIAKRRRMFQEIQEIAIENTIDDDNNDPTGSTPRD